MNRRGLLYTLASGLLYTFFGWDVPTRGSSELYFWQRILVTLAGSATFFAALLAHFAVTNPDWYVNIRRIPDFVLLGEFGVTVVVFIYGAFFALLCAWRTRRFGPMRLYALSFFFPYLFWVSIMRLEVDPELGAQGAGADPAETMPAENQ